MIWRYIDGLSDGDVVKAVLLAFACGALSGYVIRWALL